MRDRALSSRFPFFSILYSFYFPLSGGSSLRPCAAHGRLAWSVQGNVRARAASASSLPTSVTHLCDPGLLPQPSSARALSHLWAVVSPALGEGKHRDPSEGEQSHGPFKSHPPQHGKHRNAEDLDGEGTHSAQLCASESRPSGDGSSSASSARTSTGKCSASY